jgi:hypothetical protein
MSDLQNRVAKLSPEQRALLALRLTKKQAESSSRDELPLIKRNTLELPSLSPIQERLLYLHHLMPESAAYNGERVIRIKGLFNISALERSFGELLRRHEVLRTTCSAESGRLVQKIHPVEDFRLSIIDLRDTPEPEREEEALWLAQEQARRPFDLYAELMLRATLVKLAEHDHMLILTMHDFVTDGYSDAILARELGALYQSFSKGQPSPLTDLPIQYADYAWWERQRLQGAMLADQLAYWTRQLSGAPALLELPTDHPRPRAVTFRGAKEYFALGTSLSEELRSESGQMGVTLFMTLLAAYQLLLHYYSRQDEIIVAALVSNRNRPELEGLIGSFANTVAIRSTFSRDVTFRELVATVAETALEAFSNQDLPFDQLVKELHPKRDPSYNPIFQTAFEFHQDTLVDSLNLPGLSLSSLVVDKGTTRFDLGMSMMNTKDGLIGTLEYNSDLFNAETIKRLLGHFQKLLKGIVANPDTKISEFPWLTDSERHLLLEDWNSTAMDFPGDVRIQELVEAQAERTPQVAAIQFEGVQLTYGELDCRANQLARYLVGYGVGPGVLVGVCLERSVEMVVGLLGILKAGGAYVPLDPEYPKERLGFMLEDARVEVLLTQRGLLNRLPEYNGRVVCLDRDWKAIGVCNVERPVSRAKPEDLAYVIYTSGSMGRPKGVQVPHRAVVNFLTSMSRTPGLGEGDVLVAVTTLSFDIAVLELFLPLCGGGGRW